MLRGMLSERHSFRPTVCKEQLHARKKKLVAAALLVLSSSYCRAVAFARDHSLGRRTACAIAADLCSRRGIRSGQRWLAYIFPGWQYDFLFAEHLELVND